MFSEEASKRPQSWLEERRPTFICGGCEQKAKFVDARKRIPHFAMSPGHDHDEDCDFLDTTGRRNNGAGAPLPDRGPAQGNKEIRYAMPGPFHQAAAGGTGGNDAPRNGRDGAANNAPLHETTRLRALLKNLRNRSDYPPEELYLDVPDRGPAVRATDYFHKIAGITHQTPTDGNIRAYWGQISSASDDGDGKNLWINCDGNGHVFTIWLEHESKTELYRSLGIGGAGELYGAHVITEGVMKLGRKKLSVNVTDLRKIAFLPKR
ncbi:hypothetical protein [Arthrobacter sp. RAF14]|uniref:hypothetical protein n=1 Tax=Arthrobacter sp. RAF14 TaxID=3233051 RepID=UPI003F8F2C8E